MWKQQIGEQESGKTTLLIHFFYILSIFNFWILFEKD